MDRAMPDLEQQIDAVSSIDHEARRDCQCQHTIVRPQLARAVALAPRLDAPELEMLWRDACLWRADTPAAG